MDTSMHTATEKRSRACTSGALAALVTLTAACGPNETFVDTYLTTPQGELIECIPNLDGIIDADEVIFGPGSGGKYDISRLQEVDAEGEIVGGSRRWDFRWDGMDDKLFAFTATSIDDKWYVDRIEPALIARFETVFALPADVDEKYELILARDSQAVWLLGTASRQQLPDDEGTTWIFYEAPVAIYRLPLRPGDSWVSVGVARGAQLPIPGMPGVQLTEDRRDTYEIAVEGPGDVGVEGLTFESVLRISQTVTLEITSNPIFPVTVRRQFQFFSECGGEVVRLAARQDEAEPDFQLAEEVRRVRLD